MKAAEAIQFDTHKFIKRLTENGFTEQQAETLAEEQSNLLNTNLAPPKLTSKISAKKSKRTWRISVPS